MTQDSRIHNVNSGSRAERHNCHKISSRRDFQMCIWNRQTHYKFSSVSSHYQPSSISFSADRGLTRSDTGFVIHVNKLIAVIMKPQRGQIRIPELSTG